MRTAALICALMFALGGAAAESAAERALREANPRGVYDFAAEHGVDLDAEELARGALRGEFPGAEALMDWIRGHAMEPVRQVLVLARGLIAPILLTALVRCAFPSARGGGSGARFLLRICLLLGFSRVAMLSLEAAGNCLRAVGAFVDVASPAIAALLTAMGMTGTAALVSPSAALAGSMAQDLFQGYGLRLCRFALCTVLAGNLSAALDLGRVTRLIRRAANWGTGLATTLFTALLTLQGSASGAADSLAARTAKYAVDSAAPVIGSGVSDAWESYIAGMRVAKNALGVSGIASLLAVGLKPVLVCLTAMLIFSLTAALLDALGEKEAARAAEQTGGVCQMALALSTGALAIGTVLLGAAMAVGGRLIG